MFASLQDSLLSQRILDLGTRLIIIVLTLVLTFLVQRLALLLIQRTITLLLRARARLTHGASPAGPEEVQSILKLLRRPLRLMILFVGIWVALGWLSLGPVVQTIVDQIASSLIIAALFWLIYRVVEAIATHYLDTPRQAGSPLDETIIRFFRQVALILTIIAGLALVLQRWGLDVGGVFAGLGIASLAVALAAQDAISNIIAYIMIVADTPFKVGDFIVVDGQNRGRVREITFRSTRIRTLDNSTLIIPNSKVANAQITNWERVSKRRLDFMFTLPKETQESQIEWFMAETRTILGKHPQVSPERILVEFVELTDAGAIKIRVTFLARANSWEDLETVKTDINLKLMRLVRAVATQTTNVPS